MKLWPWSRTERREGYTETSTARVVRLAEGVDREASALELVAGLYADALASARVEGTDALTPELLHLVGRALVERGEVCLVIEVEDGGVRLHPAGDFEVRAGWRYRVELPEPPGRIQTRTIPASGVLHLTWARDPREPWRGISPASMGSPALSLAATAERKLADELAASTAHVLPMPLDAKLAEMRRDLASAKGEIVLAETTASGWQEGKGGAPGEDWQSRRLGPEVPEGVLKAYEASLERLCSVHGVPYALLDPDADGTSQREAYRRWALLRVEPLARRVAAEAALKLEVPVRLSLRTLWAADLQGRASAVGKLSAAGVEVAEARKLAGLGEV